MDFTGYNWFLIDVLLVAALLAALVYGTIMWRNRRRDPAVERVRDAATRDGYNGEQTERARAARHDTHGQRSPP